MCKGRIVVPRTNKGHLGTGPTFVNSRCDC